MSKTEGMFTNERTISRLYGEIFNIDCSKTPMERMINFMEKVDNPGIFHMEGYQIELEWSDTQKTIQDCIQEALQIA